MCVDRYRVPQLTFIHIKIKLQRILFLQHFHVWLGALPSTIEIGESIHLAVPGVGISVVYRRT